MTSANHPLHPLPAYTLDMFIGKLYVVNSASLVAAVHRNHKAFSFDPFVTAFTKRAGGITSEGSKLLQETANGGGGMGSKVIHSMHPALLGSGLDIMITNMVKDLKTFIDELEPDQASMDLYLWCRHAITLASTDAVYGPLNPYKDPAVERAFW
jgi:hypothetical protein